MNQDYPTTPFGRRPMTLAMVAAQAGARACPEDRPVHKWKVFRSIAACRATLGVSDRALAVLNALLTCLPETAMTPGPELIVFPSNAQLSLRAHGMAETTLRRHLAALVAAGLIIRRDSPNGKRYARRGRGEEPGQAFGFDLTPLVARAEEFAALEAAIERERRAAALARERVSILRRDIAKMIATGLEEGVLADWPRLNRAFVALSARLPRFVSAAMLEPLAVELHTLAVEIGKALELHVHSSKSDGNDSRPGAQYQNSKTDLKPDLEPGTQETGPARPRPDRQTPLPGAHFALGTILSACPEFALYAGGSIATWRDFIATAATVRGALGISPSAWEESRSAMGEADAAVTIAAILQRADEIRSPGGYLRGLTAKAAAGKFSTGPMVMALMRKRGASATGRAGPPDRADA